VGAPSPRIVGVTFFYSGASIQEHPVCRVNGMHRVLSLLGDDNKKDKGKTI
jgi:hypothetical protein